MCGRKRDDGIDVAVLSATRDLVVANGYSNFSVEGVAAHLGIAKSTVYKRWPSRLQLLSVALAEHLRQVPVTGDDGFAPSTHARVVAALGAEVRLAASPEGRAVVQAIFDTAEDGHEGSRLLRLAMASRKAALANLLAAGQQSGHLPLATDVSAVADFLFGAAWGSAVSVTPLEDDMAERLVDVALPARQPVEPSATSSNVA